jgi:ribonucleotide reductase alpha subunit
MKLSGLSHKIFIDRYSLKDIDGKPTEQSPDAMWERVARGIAQQEKTPALKKKWEKNFYDVLKDFKFVPGGRILSGAGTDYKVTYFNCFVIPSPLRKVGSLERKLIPVTVTEIRHSKKKHKSKRKFDLTIEGNSFYFVGGDNRGVVVHNSPETTTGGTAIPFFSLTAPANFFCLPYSPTASSTSSA